MNHDETPTHVYIATGRHGTKIGVAVELQRRMWHIGGKLHQSFYLPKKARRVELRALKLAGTPVNGLEWFDITPAEAVLAVETAMAAEGVSQKLSAPPALNKANRVIGYAYLGGSLTNVYEQLDRLRAVGVLEDNLHIDTHHTDECAFRLALKDYRPGDIFAVADMRVFGIRPKDQADSLKILFADKVQFAIAA